ncbi:mechanosensitive ion channel [Janibacter corallicola]|uniref:mechanosensitive ion channel n=1 Tax=Janibacter corallicola TaxID=415212 RepID=UPI0008312735|nr:mechanosensitive ion channel [Janibacter corallicola]
MNVFEDTDWGSIIGKAIAAIAILVVTWIIASIIKWAFAKLAGKIPALQKAGNGGESIGATLGSIASLLVWLLGLVAVLQVLGLQQVLTPIQELLNGVLGFLPNLIGAGIVFVVGALLAKVVRQLVETALGALPFDKWFASVGGAADKVTGTATGETPPPPTGDPAPAGGPAAALPKVAGTILYALIMIVVAIAALQILGIQSISQPASQMLETIFTVIPQIVIAGVLLAVGVFIAKFVADILQQVLDGVGLERAVTQSGVLPEDTKVTPVIIKVVQIGIVLFFAVMAAQMLEFPQIEHFLSEVIELGSRVIFGGAIIAAGLFIANLLARLVSGSAGTIVKYATIVLFVAMGLKYMGIADSIIELGFGALVVGGAAAAALAFGLGGRDAAARQLEKMQQDKGGPQG